MARKRARQEEEEQAPDGNSSNTPSTSDAAPVAKLKKKTEAIAGTNAGRANAITAGDKTSDELDDTPRLDEEEREGSGSEGDKDDDDSDGVDDGDDDDDDDDDDSDGKVRDYRKRIRRQRDKDRAATPSAGAAKDRAGEAGGQTEKGQEEAVAEEFASDGTYRNKQRVLLFSSRGITSRFRHLLADLRKLVPHHKKDVKLDAGRGESLSSAVNEIAEIKSCNSCVFLECRKRTDLYLWAGKSPDGPSAKFHVLNVHTMDELKLTGNCMLGSRPLLNFDIKFDQTPHWRVMKGILMDIFNTPRGHPKSKPFIDRIMSFFVADGKIWVRNYQIVDKGDGTASALNKKIERGAQAPGRGGDEGASDPLSLVEMGPRFVLNPIRVFAGSFGGPTLYHNAAYVSPNDARALKKRRAGHKYEDRHESKQAVRMKKAEPAVPRGPLDDVFRG